MIPPFSPSNSPNHIAPPSPKREAPEAENDSLKRQRLGNEPTSSEPSCSSSSSALEQTIECIADLSETILKTPFQQALTILEQDQDFQRATPLLNEAAEALDMVALRHLIDGFRSFANTLSPEKMAFLTQTILKTSRREFYLKIVKILRNTDEKLSFTLNKEHRCKVLSNALGRTAEVPQSSSSWDLFAHQPRPKLRLEISESEVDLFGTTIFTHLRNNNPLTELTFDFCSGFTDSAIKNLCSALSVNTTLVSLNFWDADFGDEGAKHLGKLLSTNSTLTCLDICDVNFGPIGAQHIGNGLKQNNTLIKLHISTALIEKDGVGHICDALTGNTTLRSLTLDTVSAKNEEAAIISELMHVNTTITSLNLAYNKIESEGMLEIGKIIQFTTTLKTLNLEQNLFSININKENGKQFLNNLQLNFSLTELWCDHKYTDSYDEFNTIIMRNRANEEKRTWTLFRLLWNNSVIKSALVETDFSI